MMPALRPRALGCAAHAALTTTGGRARIIARAGASMYVSAAEEMAWLVGAGSERHPRAVHVYAVPPRDAVEVVVDLAGLSPWCPAPMAAESAMHLRGGWREFASDLDALGEPRGFGAWLTGAPLAFPLDGAAGTARALATACARDDARAATEAALALVGLGGGLTPSGDDFVGAVLFGRALLGRAGCVDARVWRRAADGILAAARERTSPLSAAMLADLAASHAWAPLHELVAALAAGTPAAATNAARRLVGLGHSSGWDMLAGLGAALG
jgi:hypothetical protein